MLGDVLHLGLAPREELPFEHVLHLVNVRVRVRVRVRARARARVRVRVWVRVRDRVTRRVPRPRSAAPRAPRRGRSVGRAGAGSPG